MHTGLYTIDPFHSFAGPAGRTEAYDALVTIAGLGGTGAFLAEDLARLLTVHFGWRAHFHLADHDRVEIHNTQRQAFSRRDLDKYKAQVVAERLVRQFPIEVSVSLAPYDHRRDAPHREGPRPRLAAFTVNRDAWGFAVTEERAGGVKSTDKPPVVLGRITRA